ncbi:RloB domain-containing protein [Thiothrix subterranea]|uniref:RloB domain-containing protein n=1 Tax=Thiothrix subterranea TaxID=2735563 RepID=UPI00192B462F|nr:RloB domain-containing protein [Thiothrix subterranea]QQZ29003.1 RloB domain-containing protein [Thiothrix subterranea]
MATVKKRKANRTILIMGEGATEKAFLKHLKNLYGQRGSGLAITIRSATGGSPEAIVRYTENIIKNHAYDRVAILMDTDVEWSKEARERAKKWNITLIGATPCIEGLLLRILGHTPPHRSEECKQVCVRIFGGDLMDEMTYSVLITTPILEKQRQHITELESLLALFT